jgi:hypothetical protein
MARRVDLDLGDGHALRWVEWNPDPKLNPQYASLPAEEFHHGAIVSHATPDGRYCEGAITLDSPRSAGAFAGHPRWTVEQRDPLTLSPSLLCHCGDHGWIRDGKWVRA